MVSVSTVVIALPLLIAVCRHKCPESCCSWCHGEPQKTPLGMCESERRQQWSGHHRGRSSTCEQRGKNPILSSAVSGQTTYTHSYPTLEKLHTSVSTNRHTRFALWQPPPPPPAHFPCLCLPLLIASNNHDPGGLPQRPGHSSRRRVWRSGPRCWARVRVAAAVAAAPHSPWQPAAPKAPQPETSCGLPHPPRGAADGGGDGLCRGLQLEHVGADA